MRLSKMPSELSHISARSVNPVKLTPKQAAAIAINPGVLSAYGIGIDVGHAAVMSSYAMDSAPQGLNPTIASNGTPIQFLQNWLPGQVFNLTTARRIDELVGITTQGSWEDEEVIQTILERTGDADVYTDYGNVPLSSWNTNFERRSVVRHELGLTVGSLESAQAARMQVNPADAKRDAITIALEITRNAIGFFGFSDGHNRTFGFINDPNLPAIETVADGTGGKKWSQKTFQEIKNDLLTAAAKLRVQSGDNIDPKKSLITLAVATSAVDYLAQTTDFGVSIQDWINTNYPNWRIESAPELDSANGGMNVFYMYADEVDGTGTDDHRTFIQVVPTKMQTLGVEQRSKSYLEDYTNATAGVMCKRPYAVVRYSGI